MSDDSEKKPICSVEEFLEWVRGRESGNVFVYYRGLSDENYDVSSSIFRRLQNHLRRMQDSDEDKIPHPRILDGTQELLDEAEMLGHREKPGRSRPMRDLELLAELQHFNAATCLIDFTRMPLIALWFACQSKDKAKTGKVVAVDSGDPRYQKIGTDNIEKDIKHFLAQDEGGAPSDKFWVWEPGHQNSRITAQHSAFVFGPAVLTVKNTCVIANKSGILAGLKRLGISENRLFCDFEGFARCNTHDAEYPRRTGKDYFDFGQENTAAGKHERAVHYYTLALTLDENYVEAYFWRGYAAFLLKDYQPAIADLGYAAERFNQIDARGRRHAAAAYYLRGAAKYCIGERAKARADFEKARELAPERVSFPEWFEEDKK